MERLFKRAISAGRPDAVHADEHVELKSLGAVQRWLDTQCPLEERLERVREALVWELFEDRHFRGHALADVQWLTDNFMHEDLPTLKLLQTGETVPLKPNETQLPIFRLETIMRLTKQRRSKWIKCPNDVLTVDSLRQAFNDWKDDYKTWMDPWSQVQLCRIHQKKKHEFTRKRFRTSLFKMCGSYEFIVFWIRVRASSTSLRIFRMHFEGYWQKLHQQSKERVRRLNDAVAVVAGRLTDYANDYSTIGSAGQPALCARCGYVHTLQLGQDDEGKIFRTQFCPFCGRRLIHDLDSLRRVAKLDHFGSVLYCTYVN